MTRAVYQTLPTTLEDRIQYLLDGQEAIWQAQWDMRDRCRALLESLPVADDRPEVLNGWLEALQEGTGISHQKVLRWATESLLVPVECRALDQSPQIQVARARGYAHRIHSKAPEKTQEPREYLPGKKSANGKAPRLHGPEGSGVERGLL